MESRHKDRKHFIYCLRAEAQDDQGHLFGGHLVDVTLDGMMLIGNADFSPDTHLALSIELPHNIMGEGKLDFCARVRWCDQEADPTLFALGVSLEDMSAQCRQTLQELMVRFNQREDDIAKDDLVHNHGDDPWAHR